MEHSTCCVIFHRKVLKIRCFSDQKHHNIILHNSCTHANACDRYNCTSLIYLQDFLTMTSSLCFTYWFIFNSSLCISKAEYSLLYCQVSDKVQKGLFFKLTPFQLFRIILSISLQLNHMKHFNFFKPQMKTYVSKILKPLIS